MKNSLIALALVFLSSLIISLPMTQSRTLPMRNKNLIEKTCKKTPNYNLCVISLSKDPRSYRADIKQLSLIMVDIAKAKAVTNLKHIKELLKRSTTTGKVKQALSYCVDYYNTIVEADVQVATDALQKGDYKFAEQYSNDAGIEANECENGFSGTSSPLTSMNRIMHDVSAISAALVRVLMDSR